jgi:hypothetical protein
VTATRESTGAPGGPFTIALASARVAVGTLSIASRTIARTLERAVDDRRPSESNAPLRTVEPTEIIQGPPDASTRQPSAGIRSIRPGIENIARAVRRERARNEAAASRFFAALVPELVDGLLGAVNLTEIIDDNVDIDRVVERADIEAIVRRVDLNAAIARIDAEAITTSIDLVAIARYLMDELDFAAIIHESTSALADDSVEQLRIRGIRADRFVANVVDRIVRRGAERKLRGPGTEPGDPLVGPNQTS